MPDQVSTYKIVYDASSARKAAQDIDGLVKKMQALDAETQKIRKTFSGFAGGASRSASGAAPKLQALQKELAALALAATNARGQLNGLGTGIHSASSSADGLSNRFGLVSRSISEVVQLAEHMGEAFDQSRDYASKVADEIYRMRDATRELKSLQGGQEAGDLPLLRNIRLSAESGVDVVKAADFASRFEGAAPRGVAKGNVDEATQQQLMAQSLVTARRLGINEATMGGVAGGLPGFGKLANIERAMDQLGGATWGLEKGQSSYENLYKAMRKMTPSTVGAAGGFRDFKEAGITLGAVDAISGTADQAQQKILQTQSLLGTTDGDFGKWLTSIGIKPGQTFDEKLNIVAPHISGANGQDVLQSHGSNKTRWNRSLYEIAKENSVIQARLREGRGTDFGPRSIKANADFLRDDPLAARDKVEAQNAAAKLMRGYGEGEAYKTAARGAEAQLTAEGGIDTTSTWLTDKLVDHNPLTLFGLHRALGADNNRNNRITSRVAENLVKGFEGVGVPAGDVVRKYPGLWGDAPESRARSYNQAVADLRSRGGAPSGTDKALLDRIDKLIEVNKEQLEQARREARGGPGAPAGGGPVRPMRP